MGQLERPAAFAGLKSTITPSIIGITNDKIIPITETNPSFATLLID